MFTNPFTESTLSTCAALTVYYKEPQFVVIYNCQLLIQTLAPLRFESARSKVFPQGGAVRPLSESLTWRGLIIRIWVCFSGLLQYKGPVLPFHSIQQSRTPVASSKFIQCAVSLFIVYLLNPSPHKQVRIRIHNLYIIKTILTLTCLFKVLIA